jgi:phosphomannomutase
MAADALRDIVKAYDIRGTVPDQLDAGVARALGVAFAAFCGVDEILVGHDMRPSSPELVEAFTDGVRRQGVHVVDIGLASTDMVYFAAGSLDRPGAMFTASHNPAQYNGVKLCLAGARPVGADTGLAEIEQTARAVLEGRGPAPAAVAGGRSTRDMLGAFADHVVGFIDPTLLRPLRVVADTANGMGGLVVPAVFERLPGITVEMMYGELDGTFPNHPADPLQPENQRDLQARVVAGGFDLGLAFDGDADRVFLIDESGRGLSGSVTTALLAAALLRRHPGATILHNLICSRAVPEVVTEHGGVPVRTRVGHSYIKQMMAETGAVFGGEHSAHYYFRDNFRADSGIIATVLVIEELSRAEVPMSVLRKPFERYAGSGEINTEVVDPQATIERVAQVYARFAQNRLDGLSVDCGSWWFNLRPSNTEPLLRLNLEAFERDECDRRVAEVLGLLTGG